MGHKDACWPNSNDGLGQPCSVSDRRIDADAQGRHDFQDAQNQQCIRYAMRYVSRLRNTQTTDEFLDHYGSIQAAWLDQNTSVNRSTVHFSGNTLPKRIPTSCLKVLRNSTGGSINKSTHTIKQPNAMQRRHCESSRREAAGDSLTMAQRIVIDVHAGTLQLPTIRHFSSTCSPVEALEACAAELR